MPIHNDNAFFCHKCLKEPLVKHKELFLLCPRCKAWHLSSKGYLIVGGCIGFIAVLLGIVWSIKHYKLTCEGSYIHGLFLMLIGITSANAPRFMAEACKKTDRFGSAVIKTGRFILFMEIAYVGLSVLFMLV